MTTRRETGRFGATVVRSILEREVATPTDVERAMENAMARRKAAAERIQAGGRVRYVLAYGVARVGLGFALLAAGLMTVLGVNLPGATPLIAASVGARFLLWMLMSAPIGALIGVLWALRMWRLFEKHWFDESTK